MTININTPRLFLNLKDYDLQIMFGILITENDNAAQKRRKLNLLREKIGKAGIALKSLGEEQGVYVRDVIDAMQEIKISNYTPKGKYQVK